MLTVKKKDKVKIIAGDDKGKTGEVLKVIPETNRVVVSKINLKTKHLRPTQSDPGGRREIESPVNISKVMLICPKCSQPTRPRMEFLVDGKKTRICRKCGEMVV